MKMQPNVDFTQLDERQMRALIQAHAERGRCLTDQRPTMRQTLAIWWSRHQERKQLARELIHFSAEVLEDFGMTREDAEKEIHKPFWRV